MSLQDVEKEEIRLGIKRASEIGAETRISSQPNSAFHSLGVSFFHRPDPFFLFNIPVSKDILTYHVFDSSGAQRSRAAGCTKSHVKVVPNGRSAIISLDMLPLLDIDISPSFDQGSALIASSSEDSDS